MRRSDNNAQIVTVAIDGELDCWSLISTTAGVGLSARDGRIELRLAASEAPVTCKLAMVKVDWLAEVRIVHDKVAKKQDN